MGEHAIFLDRDNTIIEDDGYLGDPKKVKLLPGAGTALTSLRALGYRLIVVSNQSGVGRGMFKEADVEAVNDEMSRQLKEQAGAYVDASYYCPFHPEAKVPEYRADHAWRKPKAGMLFQAAADFGLDLGQCWMVGDSWRDVGAGTAAGCRTILVKDLERKISAEDERMEKTVNPNFVVRTLGDAARIIVREGRQAPPAPPPAPPVAGPPVQAASTPAAPAVEPPSAPVPPVSAEPPMVPAASGAGDVARAKVAGASVEAQRVASAEAGGLMKGGTASDPSTGRDANEGLLERRLDELVVQLRQQNRRADMRPDFGFSNMALLLVQALALAAVLVGLVKYFTMKVTFNTPQEVQMAMMSHLQALVWILAGVFLQGVVVGLLIYGRNKRG